MSKSSERLQELSDLLAESKRLMDKSSEISRQLAEVHLQIEVRTKELLDGKTTSKDMPVFDPPQAKTEE
jgi:hypothetical protein